MSSVYITIRFRALSLYSHTLKLYLLLLCRLQQAAWEFVTKPAKSADPTQLAAALYDLGVFVADDLRGLSLVDFLDPVQGLSRFLKVAQKNRFHVLINS